MKCKPMSIVVLCAVLLICLTLKFMGLYSVPRLLVGTGTGNQPPKYVKPLQESGRANQFPVAQAQEPPIDPCCSTAKSHKLEDLCSTNGTVSSLIIDGSCTCIDYIRCKLIIVTALSSNHFTESIDFFGSVATILPHTKVIVYDLGLKPKQSGAIQSYCNVQEIRKFNFDQYPEHTRDLFFYAWKPFVIKEISQEYELFFYCDASCRLTDDFIPFLLNILKFPIQCPYRLLDIRNTAIRYTHQGMLDYFGVKMTRSEMIEVFPQTFQSGILLIWVNDIFKDKILPPWVDCGEHVDCIAPKGSTLRGCNIHHKPFPAYIGCHLYDQSALNVVLIKQFGVSLKTIFNDANGIPIVVEALRYPTKQYDNTQSAECNIKYQFYTILGPLYSLLHV